MKRIATTLATSALALTALTAAAAAQETTLRVSNWLPPSHPIVKDIVQPWAEQVEEATEGRVEVQILDAPLGPPPAHFDLAATGAADVTFGVHGYTPGRFALTDIAELPFLTPSAEALSVGLWRLHENMLAEQNEHEGVKVLALWGHGPGHLFTTGGDVTPLDALEGAKVRVAGAVTNQLAEEMGMVPLQAPAPQTYELLSGGVADGIFFPYESIPFFKLDSIIEKGLRVPGGLYNVSFFFVMNEGTWNELSEENKAAIDSVSGEPLVRMAGQAWDNADAAGLEAIRDTVEFHDATDAEMEEIRAEAQAIYDAVREKVEAKGVDFDAALQMLQDETAKVASE
ncbi:TRAP transporter substrate-binding protein [Tranquillimonas alkanivorans]|uniref:TRAP-type C4-dicarboxylate transport system, substrate-binding protein n=1 Tax=Tranquillimonas alkanivorans TaxID=441119 RepID=A0A1I5UV59_9RHOB|nr:TRAP transporter substrate-binding protein [Tranquillimonas alkanivorans]SFP99123.1 TRAP-type C4-dicarboxylate transport system, substrate-binding protein [Tranquillimonas alkanivorans]